MLESFRVKDFACFSDLQIGPLGAVNLVVGRNNSGKSSLLKALRQHGGLPCCHVPSEGLAPEQRAEWWNGAVSTEEEKVVLTALRLIEPDVEGVAMVGAGSVVRLKGTPDLAPCFGHGMTQLLDLTLALANAKNGLLLIDEIENGVHYTLQPELWRIIIHTARRLNVQVFATTHSWDCIEGFQRALQHDEQDGRGIGYLIRLNRREQGVTATVYDQEELAIIVHDHVEVR